MKLKKSIAQPAITDIRIVGQVAVNLELLDKDGKVISKESTVLRSDSLDKRILEGLEASVVAKKISDMKKAKD